jgi:hypothetical protein
MTNALCKENTMLIFTLIGLSYTICMGIRAPLVLMEARIFYKLFKKKYTKGSALRITWTYVFLPGLLIAPVCLLMERRAALVPMTFEEITDVALRLDDMVEMKYVHLKQE